MTIKASDKARASLDSIIEKMENGDLSPLVKVARIRLDKSCPASRWTFSNVLLAYLQSGELDCRGYRQWQAVGRQVKKGGHGVFILAPRFVYDKEKTDDGKKKIKWTYFVTIPVFPMSQTEGDDIEYPGMPTEPMPLESLAKDLGIEVTYKPLAVALGTTTTDGAKISMGTDDAKTWFHELVHAIWVRLYGKLESGQHAHQEITADLGAITLMEVYGLGDRTGNAWEYISEYADDPVEAIHRAAAKVGEILDFVFQHDRSKKDGD